MNDNSRVDLVQGEYAWDRMSYASQTGDLGIQPYNEV